MPWALKGSNWRDVANAWLSMETCLRIQQEWPRGTETRKQHGQKTENEQIFSTAGFISLSYKYNIYYKNSNFFLQILFAQGTAMLVHSSPLIQVKSGKRLSSNIFSASSLMFPFKYKINVRFLLQTLCKTWKFWLAKYTWCVHVCMYVCVPVLDKLKSKNSGMDYGRALKTK